MWKGNHKAIFFEGLDGVGKNDLLRSVAKYILLADPSKKVLLMNFPQYWFFGHDVRLMLRGAVDDILGKQSGLDELIFRSYMYGLDRTMAVMLAESFFKSGKSNGDTIVLSDRGPFSSCVTTGYIWAGGQITEKEIVDHVVPNVFLDADAAMFDFFDGESLLCTVSGDVTETELGERKALDNYEISEVQKYGAFVYDMAGLAEVITKENGKWSGRIDTAKESLRKAGLNTIAATEIDGEIFNSDSYLIDMYEAGRVNLIGPNMLIEEMKAHKLVNKTLKNDVNKWIYLSLTSGEKYKGNRKENLDILETKIAKSIKRRIGTFDVENFHNSFAKPYLEKIFVRYPFMYEVLRRTSGNSLIKFFERILENDQLTLFD